MAVKDISEKVLAAYVWLAVASEKRSKQCASERNSDSPRSDGLQPCRCPKLDSIIADSIRFEAI